MAAHSRLLQLLIIVLFGTFVARFLVKDIPAAKRVVSKVRLFRACSDDRYSDVYDKPSDPALAKEYALVNERHFGGRLPTIPIRWEPRLGEGSDPGPAGLRVQGLWHKCGRRIQILVNPVLKSDAHALRRTLCHEMIHEHLYASGDTRTKHGPAFQTVLQRLLDEKAFEGILATESDKGFLRSWLSQEKSALASMDRDLRQERDALHKMDKQFDRLNARIRLANVAGFGGPSDSDVEALEDARNKRVFVINALVRKYNERGGEFNKQVKRYNIMVSYPDGLDEENSFQPNDPAGGYVDQKKRHKKTRK
ncbi:MAG: SprT-like domain-containing protein [Elusimicrobia bacterium]|nr:SprT-like domain-containing protein [Elusimicrobiota bacterium]